MFNHFLALNLRMLSPYSSIIPVPPAVETDVGRVVILPFEVGEEGFEDEFAAVGFLEIAVGFGLCQRHESKYGINAHLQNFHKLAL